MGFLSKSPEIKLAVLEEKLSAYEELSREMLAKLEIAVDKISEANQNVAKILVRHEERLDQSAQSEVMIMNLISEQKESRKKDIEEIDKKLDQINKRIDDISKYRWIFAGVVLLFTFVISESEILTKLWDNDPGPSQPVLEERRLRR